MAIYPKPELRLDETPIPRTKIKYYQQAVKRHIFDIISGLFADLADTHQFTQVDLAHRIEKDTGWISRKLGEPSNFTLDKLVEILVGMAIDPRRLFVELDEIVPPRVWGEDADEPKPSAMPALNHRKQQVAVLPAHLFAEQYPQETPVWMLRSGRQQTPPSLQAWN